MAHTRPATYIRPAEWVRHARTILAWPGSRVSHYKLAPGSLARVTSDVSSVADAVARFEPVTLLVGEDRVAEARKRFPAGSTPKGVDIRPMKGGEYIDLWMRDSAPTFVVREEPEHGKKTLHGVDFNFNGYGSEYVSEASAGLTRNYLSALKTERIQSSIVTEGGAIEVDGEGTLLTTESALINDNRNPGKSRQDIEDELRRSLGIKKIIWLPGVKDADVTDCHVDALARFARPGVVLLSKPTGAKADVWTRVYDEARAVLSTTTDAQGRPFEIIDVLEADIPDVGLDEGYPEELQDWPPAYNYVNFLLVNGGLILPQFGDKKADAAAVETMRRVFGNEREIVPVTLGELPMFGGCIHCATQQIPSVE